MIDKMMAQVIAFGEDGQSNESILEALRELPTTYEGMLKNR